MIVPSLLAVAAGCTPLSQPLAPIGLSKPPIRIGITKWEFMPPPFFPLPQHWLLSENLTNHLGAPVLFELYNPHQICVHLRSGRLQFAMVPPGDYSQIAESAACRLIAVPVNKQGQTCRRGLIVVAAKSPIHSLTEIKGQRFHFLPEGNVLNEAALGALLEAGLSKDDIDKGILGLGLDTHHLSSAEVAKSVILENKVAGVIDEADYSKWAKTGGVVLVPVPLPPLPSQDQVRILAQTVRVPEGAFFISTNTPPELAEKVRDYLFNVVPARKLVLDPMGYSGFAEPIDPKEYEPFCTIHRKLYPPATQEPTGEESPLTAPAESPAANE